ncbi:UNVERIFIED_CONTAM: hypothetical protein FKN15_062037 [Acipenser sinensis]
MVWTVGIPFAGLENHVPHQSAKGKAFKSLAGFLRAHSPLSSGPRNTAMTSGENAPFVHLSFAPTCLPGIGPRCTLFPSTSLLASRLLRKVNPVFAKACWMDRFLLFPLLGGQVPPVPSAGGRKKVQSDYEALQQRLSTLPDKLSYDIMEVLEPAVCEVPVGHLAECQ